MIDYVKRINKYVYELVSDSDGKKGLEIRCASKRGKYYVIPYEAGLVSLPKGGFVRIITESGYVYYIEEADKIDCYRWRSKHNAKYTFSKDKSIPWIFEVKKDKQKWQK
jgi:hypothetical protein